MEQKTRLAGVLYVALVIAGLFSLFYVPSKTVVFGDAAATARKIAEAAFLYRAGILSSLIALVLFLLLGWALYDLFEDIDKKLCRLLLLLVSVAVSVDLFLLVFRIAPLVLLSGADFLSVFPTPQLQSLAYAFLRLRSNGIDLLTSFWGLWLFPFGILVLKSRFAPRVLGVLLITGGIALVTLSCTAILFPAYRDAVSRVAWIVDSFGELPIAVWLLVKGAPATAHPVPLHAS